MNSLKNTKKETVSEKYGIVISFTEKKPVFNFIKINTEGDLAKDYINFSKKEKKVFNLIQNAKKWNEQIDFYDLLSNLKETNFKIFYKESSVKELIFKKENLISANFNRIFKDPIFPEKIDDFVLEIDRHGIDNFIITRGPIFYIQNNIFSEIDSKNKVVLNIIKRAFLKKYSKNINSYSEFQKTSLSPEEVLDINNIKKELNNIFNLNSNWNNNFEILEKNEGKEILEINYNNKDNFIEIIPMIDYGVKKISIADSVKFTKKYDKPSFNRKFNEEFGIEFLIEIKDNNIIWNKVDYEKEISFFKHLFALKNELGFNSRLGLKRKGIRQIKSFLENNWKNFKTLPFEKKYLNQKIDFEVVKFKADVDFNLKSSNDLLNLKADFYLGEEKISIQELKKYKLKKDSFINREDGTLLKIENEEELERLLSVLNKFKEKEEEGFFEGKLYHVTELQNIFTNSEYYKTKTNKGFDNFLKEIETQSKNPEKIISEIKLDEKLKKALRSYQYEGIQWLNFLKKYHFGGILADDMGLGKTIQTLALLSTKNKKDKPSIVIAPKTLLGNWLSEAKKFTPNLKTIIISGDSIEREKIIEDINNYDLILTSYSLLQRDFDIYEKNEIKFNYTILDEAQYIKNFRTKNAVKVKELDSEYRLALSGTPLENSVGEIWSIFEFLMPGFLGTQSEFNKKYIIPISKGDKKSLENLQKKISFFMMRRLKKEVLNELPEKVEQKIFIELSSDQKIIYQEILNKIKKDFLNESDENNYKKSYMHILAALTKLRQVCNHPNLILKEENYKKYNSEKLNIFNNLVKEISSENRKVLVFSQFTSMLDILENELNLNKIDFSRLDGSTNDREKVVNDFNNNKEKKVFLISLKAGGVGLNLTSADSVIIFDPWWNPSVENQAVDRAHRIGQKKSVNVYKLISKDTIEEKILNLQKEKSHLFNSIVNKTDINFKKIDWEDIKNLFEI